MNVVLFVADDQSWNGTSVQMDPEVARSRSDFYQTPNLDALAERGMRFSRAYSAAPLCQPTRASIQTGMSPAQLQYTDNQEGGIVTDRRFLSNYNRYPLTPPMSQGLTPDRLTIPRWLNQHQPDYVTAHIGKWHMDSAGTSARDMGYDFVEDIGHQGDDDPWGIVSLTNWSLEFLTERSQNNEPFFLQISHRAVHDPIHAFPDTIKRFEGMERGSLHNNVEYAAMTYDLDTSLGDVLDAIRELGMEDNTYVIYVSDNGANRGLSRSDPLGGGKNFLQEGGIRVPMVVAGPGISPGSVSNVPVITTDLLSTISDLVGIDKPLPDQVEGASFAPILMHSGTLPEGTENLVRDFGPRGELFFHEPHNFAGSSNFRIPPMSAVIRDNWKLIKLWGENGAPDQVYLVNLNESFPEPVLLNPASSLNRARVFPEIAADLEATLMRWLDGVDASLPYDVKDDVELFWDARSPGDAAGTWRSTIDVDYRARETLSFGTAHASPKYVTTQAHQPGLGDRAFRFDGDDVLTRKFFHVSDLQERHNVPNRGTPDFDRSVSFEIWLRADHLLLNQVLFESGDGERGVSITLGDGDGDFRRNDVRFRLVDADGQNLTVTTPLDQFANPTGDFVQLTTVFHDSDDNRYAEIFVNGARMARAQGMPGPEGSIAWDGYNAAALGGFSGGGLGGFGGSGPLPFVGLGFRGEIARMRFFNRALTEDEILLHYNGTLHPVDQGIVSTHAAVVVPATRPNDVSEGALESNKGMFVFQERTDVLDNPLELDFVAPILGGETVPAGTVFTSYLVHFDPVGSAEFVQTVSGAITFESPVLGLLVEPTSVAQTDALLGSVGRYDVDAHRRAASFALSTDRLTLGLTMSAGFDEVMQVRVLTGVPESISGDYNGNGVVEQGDLDLLLLHWGSDGSTPPPRWTTNLPIGLIGQVQLDAVLLNWGRRSVTVGPAVGAVPEPHAGLLLLVALWVASSWAIPFSTRARAPRSSL